MKRPYPYIPKDVGELRDQLMSVLGDAPTFKDDSGYFPQKSIDTEFHALNEGLLNVRKQIGEERYSKAAELSNRMRALFEADPKDSTGETHQGCLLIWELDELLKGAPRKREY